MIGTPDRLFPPSAPASPGRLAFAPIDLTRDEAFVSEWTGLLAAAGMDNAFLSPHWCRECARALPAGQRPLVLAARDDGGHLAAIVPALLRGRRTALGTATELAFLSEATSADHADIIAAPEWAGGAAETLAEFIIGDPGLAVVRLGNLRANSVATQVVERLARDHGWHALAHEPSPCPRLSIGGTYDGYFATLAKHTRRNLRRERRLLESDHGAQIRELRADELDAGLDWLETAHVRRWHETAATAEWSWRVLRACAHEPSPACRVRLFGCLIEGRPVAILATIWSRATVAAYRTAYDPSWSALAPGRQAFACAIEAAFNEGARVFDFLRGEGEHKSRWHAESVFDEGWTAYRPNSCGRAACVGAVVRRWAGRARRRLIRLAQRQAPESRS